MGMNNYNRVMLRLFGLRQFFLWIFLFFLLSGSSASSDDSSGSFSLPRLGLGTAGLRARTETLVNYSLNFGVRLIDTAQAMEWYDEAAVARAVKAFTSKQSASEAVTNPVVIVTKIHPRSFEYEKMEPKVAESVRNFGSHGVDVMLLHSSRCWEGHCTAEEEAVSWKEGWSNLEVLKDQYGLAMIGVSNFDISLLEELVLHHANRKVAVVQNWMDPFHQDRAVREFCRDHGIQYMAYSSFGTQWFSRRENPVLTSSVLQAIADRHDASIPQVVLSWLATEDVVAIPRASRTVHLTENFAACSSRSSDLCRKNGERPEPLVRLTAEDLEAIRALDGTIGEPWD